MAVLEQSAAPFKSRDMDLDSSKSSSSGSGASSASRSQNDTRLFVSGLDGERNESFEVPDLTGQELDKRYRIAERLGTGGFGAVYRAHDQVTGSDRALKVVVVPRLQGQPQHAREQMLQEFRLRQKINDFSYVIKSDDPRTCEFNELSLILLPMELASEGSFRTWLVSNPDREKRRDDALNFFRQTCLGVKSIHDSDQVHLDLKPENILIADGKAKVTDFGISRFGSMALGSNPEQLMRAGLGTPRYMSPEQFQTARQQDVGPAADIYSLGVILFEILDGAAPFDGSREQLKEKHLTVAPPPMKGSATAWARIVERCLAKAPDKRYERVEALLKDLERVARGAAASVDASCRKCGEINANPDHKICNSCNASVAHLFRPCPTCSKDVRLDVEHCSGCGEAVMAYHVRQENWKKVEQLKDEDPVEAIALLERMLREGAQELRDRCLEDLNRLRKHQTRISELITEADRASVGGQLEAALDAWRNILQIAPRHRVGLEKAHSLEKVVRAFREHLSKGLVLMDKADFVEAEQCLRRSVQLMPQSAEARRHLQERSRRAEAYAAAMQEGIKHQDSKHLLAALERVNSAIAEASQSRSATDLRAVLEAEINDTDGLLRLAQQRIRSAQFDKAESDLKSVENRRADAEQLLPVAAVLATSRESFSHAIEECDRAVKERDLDTALARAEEALKACPDSSGAKERLNKIQADQEAAAKHFRKAQKLINAAQFNDAIQELEHTRRLWPLHRGLAEKDVDLKCKQATHERHMAAARESLRKKEYAAAQAECSKALAICPDSVEAGVLIHLIDTEERKNALRRRESAEKKREHWARLGRLSIGAMKWLVLLGIPVGLGAALVRSWSWIWGAGWPRLVENRQNLIFAWLVLMMITAIVHCTRYTNLFRNVFSGVFGRREDRHFASYLAVTMLLVVCSGGPGYGTFWLVGKYTQIDGPASVAVGVLCAMAIQIAALLHSIVSRCEWKRA
jgi:serine/threonine protein kinase